MAKRILVFLLCAAAMLTACRESPEVMMKKQLDLGQKYLEDRNYDEALLAFRLVIDLDPKVIEAYEGIAEIELAKGRPLDAVRTMEKGAETAGKENLSEKDLEIMLDVYRGAAEIAHADGQRELTKECCRKFLEIREDKEIRAKLDLVEEEDRRITELEKRKGDLEDMVRAIAAEDDSVFQKAAVLGKDLRELAVSLPEPFVFTAGDGRIIGVYTGGYVYAGEMTDGKRHGRGLWFLCGDKEIMVADGQWDSDLPNGIMLIRTMLNEAELVKEEGHAYALKTSERVTLKDGVYEGDSNIKWTMDDGDCDHEWDVKYSEGVMQSEDGENAAFCKKCGAGLHADSDVKKLDGI